MRKKTVLNLILSYIIHDIPIIVITYIIAHLCQPAYLETGDTSPEEQ